MSSSATPSDSEHEEEQQQEEPSLQPPAGFRWRRPDFVDISRAINCGDRRGVLRTVQDTLREVGGDEGLAEYEQTCLFGQFLPIPSADRSNKPLHKLLSREIVSKSRIPEFEHWFAIGDRTVKFRAQEYALITGLRFGDSNFDPTDKGHEAPSTGIHRRLFRCRVMKIEALLSSFKDQRRMGNDLNDYFKVANILIFYFVLIGREKLDVENWVWTLVEDHDGWEWFPWGSYTFQNLSHYISIAGMAADQAEKAAYHFYGPVWAFQCWAFEAFPALGRQCATRSRDTRRPRFLHWTQRKTNFDFTDYFEDEQLEVHETLTPTPEEEKMMYYRSLTEAGELYAVPYQPPLRLNHAAAPARAPTAAPKKQMEKKKKKKLVDRVAKSVAKTFKKAATGIRTRDDVTPSSSAERLERRKSRKARHDSPPPRGASPPIPPRGASPPESRAAHASERVVDDDPPIYRRSDLERILFDTSEKGFTTHIVKAVTESVTKSFTESLLSKMKGFFGMSRHSQPRPYPSRPVYEESSSPPRSSPPRHSYHCEDIAVTSLRRAPARFSTSAMPDPPQYSFGDADAWMRYRMQPQPQVSPVFPFEYPFESYQ